MRHGRGFGAQDTCHEDLHSSYTHTHFSRVIESSFISHIVYEVIGRSRDQRDTIDWHYGLGRLGFLGYFPFSFIPPCWSCRRIHTGQKPATKTTLGYLPLDVPGHLESHSNHREENTTLSLFPFFAFYSNAFVCTNNRFTSLSFTAMDDLARYDASG